MRAASPGAIWACLGAIAAAFPVSAQDVAFSTDAQQVEAGVLTTLNTARSQPAIYVESLMNYRGLFKANIVVVPGSVDVETEEGVVPLDEAVDFLQTHPARKPLILSEVLRQAAADHVAEQAQTGETGHFGANGSSPGDRAVKHGGGIQVAEVIAYGITDAEDAVRQLIIDDGVPDRGHRLTLFADHLRYAGIACGPHPEFGTMCVIDLADTPTGVPFGPMRNFQIARMDKPRRRPSPATLVTDNRR